MLVAAPPRRPLGLPESMPLLANPPAPVITPELARVLRKLGTDDIEMAWYEYDRLVDDFKASPLGIRIAGQAGFAVMDERATGLTAEEHDLLDAAYWTWRDSLIDHAELLRREMQHCREVLAGDTICGYCGTRFLDHDAMIAHTSYCSGKPRESLGLEMWRRQE